MTITASAPGKLLLLGEYAVLEGAPALVTAVDRRAYVSLQPATDGCWHLNAPQLGLHEYTLGKNGSIPAGTPDKTRRALRLYAAVLQTVTLPAQPSPALHISIDTAEFFHADQKLGIGSSAAVAVALTCALTTAMGKKLDKPALFAWAARAHSMAQGGVGSNTDIAASVYGGNLIYRVNGQPETAGIPQGLYILPIFTGTSASTPNLVSAVYKLRDHSPALFARHMQAMHELSLQGCQAWRAGQAGGFIRAAAEYYQAMQALGTAVGADIISPAHQQLHRLAEHAGAVYKPSGAGGGDIGLLICNQADRTDALAAAVAEAGYNPLAMQLRASGAHVL